jgi:demethoxyubiquinone hydroxylase (CLK1/Coq7/Cat5 family)
MYHTSLRRLIRKFLMLEIGAVALYRVHGRMVSKRLRPLFQEFLAIEINHREQFAALDRSLHAGRGWWARPFLDLAASVVACITSLAGTRAILRFERSIEQQAVRDYSHALTTVEHAGTRVVLEHVLADELRHDRLTSLLMQYRGDEERHVKELEKALDEHS